MTQGIEETVTFRKMNTLNKKMPVMFAWGDDAKISQISLHCWFLLKYNFMATKLHKHSPNICHIL